MSNPAPTPAPTPTPTPAPVAEPTTPTILSVSSPSSEFVPEAQFEVEAPETSTGSGWDNFDW